MADESLLVQILNEIRAIKSDISGLKNDISGLKNDISGLKNDISGLKNDISGLKNDVSGLKNNVSQLKSDVSGLKSDVSELKIRQLEDHQILKALEHKADVNKAEHDKMLMDISEIQGYQKNISENIDAIKEIIGRHEVDITVLKRRPV